MKATPAQLRAKLLAMPVNELRLLVSNVVCCLYQVTDADGENPELDSEKVWDGDTLRNIAADVENSNLSVGHIAKFRPRGTELHSRNQQGRRRARR